MNHSSLPTKPALLIVNPVSGQKKVLRALPEIIRALMDGGYLVTVCVTSRRGEAAELSEALAGQYELVCCAGGDGTLNETLSGLCRGDHRVPLGYLPCGSTNDFAASHGLASDLGECAASIASGRSRRYDVGRFGESYFSYVAAFGAFSWLSYTTDQNAKNLLGHTAYILDGIKDLPKVKPYTLRLTADGAVYEGSFLFGAVCNTLSVAGTLQLPEREVDTCDGVFEVLLVREPKTLPELQEIVTGLLTQDYSSPMLEFFHARKLTLECPPDLDWTVDGEFAGHYERVTVEPLPGFLELRG